MSQPYYVTTPIFYVNDVPHIGHAYTSIACDVLSRFQQLNGREVKFLTGTDEHGQKIQKSANLLGQEVQSFVDKNAATFQGMMQQLNIDFDDFIRTTEVRHKRAVEYLWQKLEANGYIYQATYKGWYAMRDEAFYAESELTPDGLAPTGAPVEWLEEPSYFFALSKFQEQLLAHYQAHPEFIMPATRRNEVVSFVESGLKDLSISRSSFNWGIQVPGSSEHVIYVWLDALTNYISALGYPDTEGEYAKYWPANVHVVGKDILRFHAVYWPAFLLAANLPLPKTIMAHGWWTNEGQKISKSLGNVIEPMALVQQFGLDQVRYFLMREISFGNDGNFAISNLVNRCNSELANKIGNLLQRSLAFAYKYCDAALPQLTSTEQQKALAAPIFTQIDQLVSSSQESMKQFQIHKLLENIINIAELGNNYIDQQAPWQLRSSDLEQMRISLYVSLEITRYIAILLQPVTPDSAKQMLDQLSVRDDLRQLQHLSHEYALTPGLAIDKPQPIFNKLTIEE